MGTITVIILGAKGKRKNDGGWFVPVVNVVVDKGARALFSNAMGAWVRVDGQCAVVVCGHWVGRPAALTVVDIGDN